MKREWIFLFAILGVVFGLGSAPGFAQVSDGMVADAHFIPFELGTRFDDNVSMSVSEIGRLSDDVYSFHGGGVAQIREGWLIGNLEYQLGSDIYQFYSQFNNFKNDFDLNLSARWGSLIPFYKNESFVRSSSYSDFDYFDEGNFLGMQWLPGDGWTSEVRYKNLSRQYFNQADPFRSRDFIDNGIFVSFQKEWSESFLLKFESGFNDRQLNRNTLVVSGPVTTVYPSDLQHDKTWSMDLGAHLYFANILQDVHFDVERTDSNSYSFSNSVESFSWAGVLSPVENFYLQLFFRIYVKTYDFTPLSIQTYPDLQLGFVDEDGQDLLSVKGTWDWAPQWNGSLGLSRLHTESTQPGEYYIKNVLSVEINHDF
jgi:hypothetical protein